MDEFAKSLPLGLALMNVAGESVLKNAVGSLGPTIRAAESVTPLGARVQGLRNAEPGHR
jgi:hypothetical protein